MMSRPALRLDAWRWLLATLLLAGLWPVAAQAGPARPDPKQMSGIPRPDPQLPAGEITVRVLDGDFDKPVLGATVELELRSADGRSAELRTAEAGNQGRAYFRDLGPFAGGLALARVQFDGTLVRSQQIEVRPDVGTAVMLVKGAPSKGPTQEISLPGIVFDFPGADPGSLMVGTFDMSTGKGIAGIDVELLLTAADGTVETKTQKTEARGQTVFAGLGELAEGTTAQVRAQIEPEGEPYRSASFTPVTDRGQAIVLAKGRIAPAGGSPHGGAGAPNQGQGQGQAGPHAQRQPMPGPRVSPQLPLGSVQVLVVDGNDKPVAGHEIAIVKKDFAGTEQRFSVTTSNEGIARVDDLPVVNDALYYVGVVYEGGPYTSAFFGLDKRGGVTVAMRVWPTTSDPAVAQSAVQFEIIEGENDAAQVIQVYEVLVQGDKAYWPGKEPLRIEGLPGAKGMVVLRGAEQWLEHEEKAPYATLAHPIEPGGVAALSIGYIVDGHGGQLDIEWVPPFRLLDSAVVLSEDLELEAAGATPSERDFGSRPGLDYTPVAFQLGQTGTGPVKLSIRGLRQTEKLYANIAIAIGGVMLLVVAVGLATRPKGTPLQRLQARRASLLEALEHTKSDAQRRRLVTALDRVYRKIEVLSPGSRG